MVLDCAPGRSRTGANIMWLVFYHSRRSRLVSQVWIGRGKCLLHVMYLLFLSLMHTFEHRLELGVWLDVQDTKRSIG